MLSARSIFDEIRRNDEAFRFLVSVAAKGETQGGFENARIAALTEDPELSRKIARHGLDESKHGRIFGRFLERRNLQPCEVPLESDYCMQLERRGVGLPHRRLQEERPLATEEILDYLAHSRVTEQRASEEVDRMVAAFRDDPELGPALRLIADDEVNHLSYCHEELRRLAASGHDDTIRRKLRHYARAEIDAYRRTSLSFVRRMGRILGWGPVKRALLATGVLAVWLVERSFTWRRMVRLAPPIRPGALG